MEENISLVQECVNKYVAKDLDQEVEIRIRVPKRFGALWLTKLSNLYTTTTEIEEYQNTPLDLEDKE